MLATIQYNSKTFKIDLSKPLDISIPISSSINNVTAWGAEPPKIEPVVDGEWIAMVSEGAAVNFNNIMFNPHSHGTGATPSQDRR